MAGSVLMGFAGPQDLIYGFSPKSVVERLTSKNWRRKAVMRQDKHGELYIWVSRGKKEEDGKKRVVHVVDVMRPLLVGERRTKYDRYFNDLEDALRYANGEDRSALSRYSRPMGKMILNERGAQLLGAHPAPTIFSVMGVGHKGEVPELDDDQIQPDGYACFLTEVLESILAVSPGISKHVYKYGFTLHPDVEGRKSYGPKSDLPERIMVRCYRSEKEVIERFHVFPKDRVSRGLMRVMRLDDSKGQAGGKKRCAEMREPRKPSPRS